MKLPIDAFGFRTGIMAIAKGLTLGYIPVGGALVCDEVANTLAAAGGF